MWPVLNVWAKKGYPRFWRLERIFLVQGFVFCVFLKISCAKECFDLVRCSRKLNELISIFVLRGSLPNSDLHASFEVLQWTPKISLINLTLSSMVLLQALYPNLIALFGINWIIEEWWTHRSLNRLIFRSMDRGIHDWLSKWKIYWRRSMDQNKDRERMYIDWLDLLSVEVNECFYQEFDWYVCILIDRSTGWLIIIFFF